jgi:hypothetical protein
MKDTELILLMRSEFKSAIDDFSRQTRDSSDWRSDGNQYDKNVPNTIDNLLDRLQTIAVSYSYGLSR